MRSAGSSSFVRDLDALYQAELITESGSVAALSRGTLRAVMRGKLASAVAGLVILITVVSALAQTTARPVRSDRDLTHGQRPDTRPQPPGRGQAPPLASRLPEHARARLGTTRLRHGGSVANVAFAPD